MDLIVNLARLNYSYCNALCLHLGKESFDDRADDVFQQGHMRMPSDVQYMLLRPMLDILSHARVGWTKQTHRAHSVDERDRGLRAGNCIIML